MQHAVDYSVCGPSSESPALAPSYFPPSLWGQRWKWTNSILERRLVKQSGPVFCSSARQKMHSGHYQWSREPWSLGAGHCAMADSNLFSCEQNETKRRAKESLQGTAPETSVAELIHRACLYLYPILIIPQAPVPHPERGAAPASASALSPKLRERESTRRGYALPTPRPC